jgi:hypothetical protein
MPFLPRGTPRVPRRAAPRGGWNLSIYPTLLESRKIFFYFFR